VGTPETREILRALDWEEEMIEPAPDARQRFIVRHGRPVAVPLHPAAFLTSPLFSLPAKLRLLREPFIAPRPADAPGEESLADFVRRRLGSEMFAYAAEPFVAGIYAGDPEKLALRYAFPGLHGLEARHGSLTRGALAMAWRRTMGERRQMYSFRAGMTALPRAFAAQLADAITFRTRVTTLQRRDDGLWQAVWETPSDSTQELFDAVIVAVPAYALAGLPLPPALTASLAPLAQIPHPPVAVVALGYPRAAVRHSLDGFGMLTPACEKLAVLGVLFPSSIFPGRAPAGQVLLTAFVGGARQPEMAGLPDDELVEAVARDVRQLLGAEGPPVYRRIIRWPHAIPQYGHGHGTVLDALTAAERDWPGLALTGSYRAGVSVAQCLEQGRAAAGTALGLAPETKT
jgi:oxygen-dependent protoporphyrinogen oxidase